MMPQQPAGAGTRLAADQRGNRQVLDADEGLGRPRMPRRRDRHHRLMSPPLGEKPRPVIPPLHQREIDFRALQRRRRGGIGRDRKRWHGPTRCGEVADQGRQNVHADIRTRPQAQRGGGEDLHCARLDRHQAAGDRQEPRGRLGGRAAGPVTVDQRHGEAILQPSHMLRHGGLGQAQPARGHAEPAGLHQREEAGDMRQV